METEESSLGLKSFHQTTFSCSLLLHSWLDTKIFLSYPIGLGVCGGAVASRECTSLQIERTGFQPGQDSASLHPGARFSKHPATLTGPKSRVLTICHNKPVATSVE